MGIILFKFYQMLGDWIFFNSMSVKQSLWHLEDYASKKNKEKDFVSNESVYTQKNIKEY